MRRCSGVIRLACQFGAVRLDHASYAREAEIIMRHVTGMHCGAKPFIGMPAVNPAIFQTVPVGRCMVMKHAFGGVQDIAAADPARS